MISSVNKGFDKETFKKNVIYNVKSQFRKTIDEATPNQVFQAVAYAVKDVIIDEWIATHKEYEKQDVKTLYYLSMEFLMGRALGNNIINIMAKDEIKQALDELGYDLNRMQLLETAVWAVWQHAFWTLLPHWDIRHMAAESVTAMVCSSRKLRTDTRWRFRMSG